MKNFKSPLSIYVLWHPEFKEGANYAESIYNTFSGENGNVTHAKYDIPVHYRTLPFKNETFANEALKLKKKERLVIFGR